MHIAATACSLSGGIGDPPAVVRPVRCAVAGLAIGEHRHAPVLRIQAVQLEELAAAGVLLEHHAIPRAGLEARIRHRFLAKSDLRARTARHLHHMHLGHLGKAGGNQELTPSGMPSLKLGAARLEVSAHLRTHGGGVLRNAISDKTGGHLGNRGG